MKNNNCLRYVLRRSFADDCQNHNVFPEDFDDLIKFILEFFQTNCSEVVLLVFNVTVWIATHFCTTVLRNRQLSLQVIKTF